MYEKIDREEMEANKPFERKTKTAEQALNALMRYASKAERSSGDALRLMQRWGVPEADRGRVLARLTGMGFIDDNRFAAAYVREKSTLSGWGIYKIAAGLRAKGIPKEIVESALHAVRADGDANSRLSELLARKLKSTKGGTKYEVKGKLVRFGLARGYEYDAVLDAVETVLDGFDDADEE